MTEPDPVTETVSGYICVAKLATTDFAASMKTTHVPVPEHPPPVQPVNMFPLDGTAVSVTVCPAEYVAEHVVPDGPQLMLPGVPVIVPGPDVATLNEYVIGAKVAVTDVEAFIVTVHVLVPVHAPVHPANTELPSGAAVSVTTWPAVYDALQVDPQVVPLGTLVTVPEPAPERDTDSV